MWVDALLACDGAVWVGVAGCVWLRVGSDLVRMGSGMVCVCCVGLELVRVDVGLLWLGWVCLVVARASACNLRRVVLAGWVAWVACVVAMVVLVGVVGLVWPAWRAWSV